MRQFQVVSALLAGASMLSFVSQASAAQAAPNAAASAPAAEGEAEAIIVTGSRVIQNGNNSPTPLTIVSTQQLLTTSPSNVVEAVQQLPAFAAGASGPQANPGNSVQNTTARTLSLRNIGPTRTLVLFDGHRVPPTLPGGVVNADIVPSMLLQRVDIVTGGASAVYGSDAVAGVVNFVTDRKFNGLKVEGLSGISQRGDANRVQAGIAGGIELMDGRLHLEASYQFYHQSPIKSRLDRAFGQQVYTQTGAGTAANPFHITTLDRLSSVSYGGLITNVAANGVLKDMEFATAGVLTPFVHGAATGTSGTESGGNGEWFKFASLVAEQRTHQIFGRADYDVSSDVHAYAEIVGMKNYNQNFAGNVRFAGFTLSNENAFLPGPIAAQLPSTFIFGKSIAQVGGVDPTSNTNGYIANLGLEGNFGGWKWDVGFVHGFNKQETFITRNVDRQKAVAALDAVTDPATGKIVCRVSLTNPGLYPGCVPLNLFGPNSETPAMLNYILARTGYTQTYKQNDVSGSLAGSPFDTWAGPVQVAISGDWRKLDYQVVSTAQPSDRLDCTGIRMNCALSGKPLLPPQRWATNVVANALGTQSVSEGAIEANVPLLKDAPLVQSFNINGALRYTHYNTSGNVTTWKIGLDWAVNDDITFRATRSRDIRAPNVEELFAPEFIGPTAAIDAHLANAAISASNITRSNPNLKPEKADTWTAGVVLKPSFIPNFSLAIDWYRIKINNAIVSVAGSNTTVQNICETSNGTSPYCDLIVRPLPFSDRTAANAATAFISRPENAQSLYTNGVDVEANYRVNEVFGGNLNLRALVSYQPHLTTISLPGIPALENAGVTGGPNTNTLPKWRAVMFAKYTHGGFSLDVQERWRSGLRYNADPALIFSDPPIPAAAYTNLTLTYALDNISGLKHAEWYLAVENLFDKQPTPVGGAAGAPGLTQGYPAGDDILGRYFSVGVRIKM